MKVERFMVKAEVTEDRFQVPHGSGFLKADVESDEPEIGLFFMVPEFRPTVDNQIEQKSDIWYKIIASGSAQNLDGFVYVDTWISPTEYALHMFVKGGFPHGGRY